MYRLASVVDKLETPKTFRVAEPYTMAEFTYKVPEMLADPRTYRFDPTGGALKVPMDTPF